jgi:hypothetical protein
LQHELAHAVIAENLHEVPQWLNEGLATLLATADVDPRSGKVTWGALTRREDSAFGAQTTTLSRLLDGRPWAETEMGRFEFSAGLLVRMLVHRHPRELACLLGGLSPFEPYAEAFEECFPDGPDWGWDFSREPRQAFSLEPSAETTHLVLFLSLERQGKCDEARAFLVSSNTAKRVRAHLTLPYWSQFPRPAPCAAP